MEGSGSVHSLTRTASDYCSLLNILNDKKELYVLYLKHSNYLLTTYCVASAPETDDDASCDRVDDDDDDAAANQQHFSNTIERTNLEFASVSDGELVEGRGRADSMEGSGSVHSLTRTASDYCSLLNILNDKKELYVLYLKHSNYLLTTYCVGIYCLAFLFE
ncbi:hypothetical protein TcasGA2_TC032633 [Tribolium castaneum]|uniref:Uncharacterized protein n=1 Tax=Tribolium castaneum TaxID=7070 RepID=A0A139W9L2_TRICA|nr:hypothetical protein TcasGA2_TC032633 [Tribolium castaneum]